MLVNFDYLHLCSVFQDSFIYGLSTDWNGACEAVNPPYRREANLDHGNVGAVWLDDSGDGSGGAGRTQVTFRAWRANRTNYPWSPVYPRHARVTLKIIKFLNNITTLYNLTINYL